LRIANAVDLHCHFSPDTVGGGLEAHLPTGVTALEAAREARAEGHVALVLKSHSFASPALADAMSEAVPGVRVFGGICTDFPSGGLNVAAVDAALAIGARIVWLPTLHSFQDTSHHNPTGTTSEGIRVTDDAGRVVPEVEEIFAMVRAKDAILATGHISAEEHYAVVTSFARSGKVLVTHAGEEMVGPRLTPSQCRDLAELGATIELTALTCRDVMGIKGKTPAELIGYIRAIEPRRCTLSTDYGWSTVVPRPAAGLGDFIESLWAEGLSEDDLATMASRNPARLLNLQF
jgi:hypothetical protein